MQTLIIFMQNIALIYCLKLWRIPLNRHSFRFFHQPRTSFFWFVHLILNHFEYFSQKNKLVQNRKVAPQLNPLNNRLFRDPKWACQILQVQHCATASAEDICLTKMVQNWWEVPRIMLVTCSSTRAKLVEKCFICASAVNYDNDSCYEVKAELYQLSGGFSRADLC